MNFENNKIQLGLFLSGLIILSFSGICIFILYLQKIYASAQFLFCFRIIKHKHASLTRFEPSTFRAIIEPGVRWFTCLVQSIIVKLGQLLDAWGDFS